MTTHRLAHLLAASALLGLMPCGLRAQTREPILIGASGPLTGPQAQYGQAWKKGFDLALEDINGSGGIKGRPLQIVFTDTQNDPKQTVATAQKYIANPRIVLATGDFSSTSSMAASALYQRAGLVQLGFTNSSPLFTKGGDFIWSNAPSQSLSAPAHAAYVRDLGLRKVAVFQLNSDWGKVTGDLTVAALARFGVQVTDRETYLPDEKDFRTIITKAKATGIDGFVLVSYVNDATLLVQQIRGQGSNLPIVTNSSQATVDFPRLGGLATEGVYVAGDFSPDDPRPEVQALARKWHAKYHEELEYYSVQAYDSIKLAAAVIAFGGPDRTAVRDAFARIRNVPSVVYGRITFDPGTRRVSEFLGARLVVKNGKFAVWTGKKK
jgi:branched-chain amino acid transport system substrate-binding protein